MASKSHNTDESADEQTGMEQTTHHINESADPITLKTKLKRGTATRDEDKYQLKVKGDTPEQVAEEMAALQQSMIDSGLVTSTRAMQPEETSLSSLFSMAREQEGNTLVGRLEDVATEILDDDVVAAAKNEN